MELSELLDRLDKASANLAKVERTWQRAQPFIPKGPALGSDPEYDDLVRAWPELLAGLPPIDGFVIDEQLPDLNDVGQSFLDYADVGELPTGAWELAEGPAKQISEYRWRLRRARRTAVRARLAEISAEASRLIDSIVHGLPADGFDQVVGPDPERFREMLAEIERLLGDAISRQGRWGDLHRHLRFSQRHDWVDIQAMDWPSVKLDIEANSLDEDEPIAIPMDDLGTLSASHPTGGVTTELKWSALSEDAFERLLYDLCRGLTNWDNVEWLTRTNAPDRGRDLSAVRRLEDGSGAVRNERTMIQLKHWQSKSVPAEEVAATMVKAQLWTPRFAVVVIATSGRFTTDAIAWTEQHNDSGASPLIELWPESRLETMLAVRPDLVAAYALR